MNHNHTFQIPEEFQNIPASFFALNPGAQAMLGGFVVFDYIAKAEKKLKLFRKLAGTVIALWAFFHPGKCHKATIRKYWDRRWMFD